MTAHGRKWTAALAGLLDPRDGEPVADLQTA